MTSPADKLRGSGRHRQRVAVHDEYRHPLSAIAQLPKGIPVLNTAVLAIHAVATTGLPDGEAVRLFGALEQAEAQLMQAMGQISHPELDTARLQLSSAREMALRSREAIAGARQSLERFLAQFSG